jgi:hypothetical protein
MVALTAVRVAAWPALVSALLLLLLAAVFWVGRDIRISARRVVRARGGEALLDERLRGAHFEHGTARRFVG